MSESSYLYVTLASHLHIQIKAKTQFGFSILLIIHSNQRTNTFIKCSKHDGATRCGNKLNSRIRMEFMQRHHEDRRNTIPLTPKKVTYELRLVYEKRLSPFSKMLVTCN